MTYSFQKVPRRDDPNGHMVVWQLLQDLRDYIENQLFAAKAGIATVPQGATTGIVTHGLNKAANRVLLTPLVDPGGRYWVDTKDGNSFRINLQIAAPVGGITFDWWVKGD